MQNKHKLSFSVLLMSTCLVQSTTAAESGNGELKRIGSVGGGGTVPKGSALITNVLPSNNIKIEDGGVEVVDNGKTSIGATIEKGGMQIVTRGGTAINTKILGGKQFVHEETGLDLTRVNKPSSAYDATVSGGGGVIGLQNIYDAATAWNTKVEKDGEQNLYAGQRKEGGKAMKTVVSQNGRQHVLALGESHNTTLQDQAIQVVYPSGLVNGLTINSSASSWLHVGAQDVTGAVRVNNGGKLYLFAGDRTNHTTKKTIPIQERAAETIFLVGERNTGEKPEINIKDLGGNDGTVIFTSIPYDPRHISLRVGKLSGNLHFRFNIDTTGGSDYLSIEEGEGDHKISVSDYGREITGSSPQKNNLITEILLITDRSSNGGANFTLEDYVGKAIESVDGGTYMYSLRKRERCAEYSGDSTIWYLGLSADNAENSNTEVQCAKKKSKVPMSSFVSSTDTGSHQEASSRRRGSGSRKPNNKQEHRPRPPRHLRDVQNVTALSASPSSENRSNMVFSPADRPHPSDEKQQAVVSADASLTVDQMVLRPSNQHQTSPQSRKEISKPRFLTTPSTDAVLSMSVAPGLIFHNELQAIRAG
ncbi:pertactin-like passenger domain-containing protein, partial [Bartonella florencae]|uniref:pertactin-like passenger domain-containing protein n=1 Tax=Bartonella florencae TaxID=928210 RepID=UPI0005698224